MREWQRGVKAGETHVWRWSVALEIRLNGAVLLVEEGHIRYKILHNVHVREGVYAGFLGCLGRNSACPAVSSSSNAPIIQIHIQRQARVLTPSIFIAQLPQIPSRQLRLNVKVGSCSFLIRISASNIIGPVLFRSSVYDCMCGFDVGSSGFHR
jgi:hypothetical protein